MNNILNTKMRTLLTKKVISGFELDAALQQLLIEGFVGDNGCYFLPSLYKQQSHIHASGFVDHTGYECFINSIHIDDYVTTNVLEQALLFADQLIHSWNAHNNEETLILILGETGFGFNLKFHLFREKESWINENDIDKFEEAILIFKSNQYDY